MLYICSHWGHERQWGALLAHRFTGKRKGYHFWFPQYLLSIKRDEHVRIRSWRAVLRPVLPALQQLLLLIQALSFPLHAPLALPESLQVLLVFLELLVQLYTFTSQPLRCHLALPLPLFQHALLRPLLTLPSLALSLPAFLLLAQAIMEPLGHRRLLLLLLQVTLLLLILEGAAPDTWEMQPLGTRGRAAALLEKEPLDLIAAVLDGHRSLAQRGESQKRHGSSKCKWSTATFTTVLPPRNVFEWQNVTEIMIKAKVMTFNFYALRSQQLVTGSHSCSYPKWNFVYGNHIVIKSSSLSR